MSKKRYVDTKFWDDNYIIEKDPVEKLLFLYLLTNTLTNIIGIYEISINRIAFDTGIDKDMVIKILERFEADDKIKYENGWIAIKKFISYQQDNPKIRAGISYELKKVPQSLIDFIDILDYEPTEKEFKGKKVHKNLREKILKKYDDKCCFCGSKDNLEIDHIIPVFQGGTNDEDNLRVLCQSCNGKRNAGLRWNKEKNGWDMGTPSENMGTPSEKMGTPLILKPNNNNTSKDGSAMGSLSHPNPNPNPNLNTNTNTKGDVLCESKIVEIVDKSLEEKEKLKKEMLEAGCFEGSFIEEIFKKYPASKIEKYYEDLKYKENINNPSGWLVYNLKKEG